MKRLLLIPLAVLCAMGALLGDEPKEANRDVYQGPVVVLKNGTVLRGKGTNLGEKIVVELVDGGEVKLLKGQVEIVADSLDDAYLQRRAKLLPENVLSQVNLAYWCLDQGMKVEAVIHLKAAKKIDSSHPGVSRLQKKINEQTRIAEEELPEKVVEPPATQDLKEMLKKRMESARRDSRLEAGDVSQATKVRFNKEVQPILLGSCAASKCHGPNSPHEFRLVRSSTHSENHAVLVKRNLQTVLSRLNVDTPEESPLLEKAVGLHGAGMKTPPLELSSREFSLLVDWVIAATDDLNRPGNGATAPAVVNSKPPATITPNSSSAATNRSPRNGDLEDEMDAGRGQNGEPRVAEKTPRAKKSSGLKPPVKREEEEAPGDPSEFNRKYFRDEPK